MSAFVDARAVPAGSTIETDLAIIGGGPAGISLALALANTPIRMLLLESGGTDLDPKTQALYAGSETGVHYLPLEASRLRYLGGSSNHWGGWSRPLDPSDFEKRDWLPHSGWPFSRAELDRYLPRAQAMIEAGPMIYDRQQIWTDEDGAPIPLAPGGVYTSYFQFSKTRDSDLPTPFGHRYGGDLKRIANLQLMLHANVTGLRLAANAQSLDRLDVATLSGRKFTVKPKYTVVAVGGIENARLLLASNDVMAAGVGNGNDLVGRFFADHPIPRQTATLVKFDGKLAPYYTDQQDAANAHYRAAFSPTEAFKAQRRILGSLTTVENSVPLDELGKAALATTAAALGVDASQARAFSLGCGMEMSPDPDRRFTLSSERDALGMPRLKLHMTISDDDLARYRDTMKELGRQLLVAKTGMIHLDRKERAEWLSVMDWGNHHMGTTRMHVDPKQGVVDANSRVHGIGNLYVAGSSVFPTYGSSNPTLNLVAMTLRLAEHLKTVFP
ncbi:MAG TPA: GMC family oxidoreductase [Rhizomicrobium sp.]|nr:GMC family oxidoreductase [Rhizomicrobium sp.]